MGWQNSLSKTNMNCVSITNYNIFWDVLQKLILLHFHLLDAIEFSANISALQTFHIQIINVPFLINSHQLCALHFLCPPVNNISEIGVPKVSLFDFGTFAVFSF